MKSISFYCIITLFCLAAIAPTALAQRTAKGSILIGVDQQMSFYRYPSGGLDLNGGMYLQRSYWKAGLSATNYNAMVGTQDDEYFDHTHFVAYGDWMYRAAATYGRELSLYMGGGIYLGCNYYELFRELSPSVSRQFPEREFIYGIKPSFEAEVYFCPSVAFILGVSFPFTFSSSLSTDIVHIVGAFGIRICI